MKPIVLTGMPGSGKTSVGKYLSSKLNKKFADIDTIIKESESLDIPSIFESKGEEYFRAIEAKIVKDVLKQNDIIISLGGGSFENEQNRTLLLKNSIVIYLETSVETLYNRTKNSDNRPLLSVNPQKKIIDLFKIREKNYKLAHFSVLTDNKTIGQITDEILECASLK